MMFPLLATKIKYRKKEHLIERFITVYNTLKKVRIIPIPHRIDNEYSKELNQWNIIKWLQYQIVPPCNHPDHPTGNLDFEEPLSVCFYRCATGFPTHKIDWLIEVVIIT